MDIHLHKSCDTLPIYNFYKVVDTMDLNYLAIGYNDLNELNVKIDKELATKNWNAILSEYSELTANREVLANYEKQIEILYLETIIKSGEKILENYEEYGDIEILLLLNDFDYSFDEHKNIENQINMVIRKIKGYRNKVRILKSNYEQRFRKKDNEAKESNLTKDALSLELSLDIGREIDIRTTSVSKWIYMFDLVKEKSRNYEKLKNK
jgi:hypothetical protein